MIIGGYFGLNPWQRGTTFTAIADGTYTADRFFYNKVGTMVHTVERSADAPLLIFPYPRPIIVSTNSLLIDCTTADASIAAGDLCTLGYRVEGYDYCYYAQQPFMISFWVKATKTGTYCLAVRNAGVDRSCIIEYTIDVANTWELKALDIPATPTAGTWNYSNGIGLEYRWVLAAGTTFQTATTDAWVVGDFLATANQVNGCDSILNNFQVEGISFSPGTVAFSVEANNPLKTRDDVLKKCQRYYQKSYNQETDPATATAVGAITHINALANVLSGADRVFAVSMCDTPTMGYYSTVTGTAANIRNVTAGADVGTTGTTSAGMYSTGVPTVAAIAADQAITFHWTADAEL